MLHIYIYTNTHTHTQIKYQVGSFQILDINLIFQYEMNCNLIMLRVPHQVEIWPNLVIIRHVGSTHFIN